MKNKLFAAALGAVFLGACASNPGMVPAPAPAAVAETGSATNTVEAARTKSGAAQDRPTEETITNAVASRTESSKDADDKVICRQITPTGSHRKKMICRTVKDIRQARDESQDAVRGRQGPALRPPP